MNSFVIAWAFALDGTDAVSNTPVLARKAEMRRKGRLISTIALVIRTALRERAVISARNELAKIDLKASPVIARIAHSRVVPVFTKNCFKIENLDYGHLFG